MSVIGVGNVLMGDDGVGVRVIERLADDPAARCDGRIEYLDGGVGGLRLLNWIEQARRLLFIDAANFAGVPGRAGLFHLNDLLAKPRTVGSAMGNFSLHQTDPVSVLGLAAQFSRCPPTWLLAVQVKSVERRDGLSPALAGALPRLVETARRIARRLLSA